MVPIAFNAVIAQNCDLAFSGPKKIPKQEPKLNSEGFLFRKQNWYDFSYTGKKI